MKKGVLAVIIIAVVVIAVILLLSFNVFSGYASWAHQSQSASNELNKCEETDSGKDYANPGTATWTFKNKKYNYKDFCTLGVLMKSRITEYYCTKEGTAAPVAYDCAAEGKTCKKSAEGAYCG